MTTSGESPPAGRVVVLSGETTSVASLFAELWRSRSVFGSLSKASFTARYRSATLGILWSVLLPIVQATVLVLVFTRIVRLETGPSFPLYILCGTVTFNYFATSLSEGSTAIVEAGAITTRIYFSRLVPPGVSALANVVSLIIGYVILSGFSVISGMGISWRTLVMAPAVVTANFVFTWLLAAVVSLLHVYSRDVRYVTQAAVLIWFYLTPIFFTMSLAGQYSDYLVLNPVTGLVQLFRFAIMGEAERLADCIQALGGWMLVMLILNVVLYSRFDRVAADRL